MTYINFVLIYFALVKSSLALTVIDTEPYKPNWKSIDSRPLPSWYDEAKIGIFLHWGVFSVPSFRSEWFWQMWKVRKYNDCIKFMEDNYPPGFSYQEFAKDFTAELFNATQWAEIFEDAGAKYVVLTTKHHEGFTLWPSEYSYSWNAKDVGPHRDIVDELGKAVRAKSLHYGLYHSLYEWFNPMYLADNASNYQQSIFVERKILPEMKELINNYQPDLLWSDGDAGAPDTYWKATEFLAWLYNESPVKDKIVVNDRWGAGTSCKHGGYYTCRDRYNPGVLQQHKWENAMTLDKHSWGYRRNTVLEDYLTIEELLVTLASTVSCGGNLLLNVGPSKDGTIDPIFQDRLYSLGKWLKINGEAIYGNKPWKYQNDSNDVWYTSKNNSVYAIVLSWPVNDTLVLSKALDLFETPYVSVTLLGETGKLKWSKISSLVNIHFPNKATVQSEWSWTLKITKN